MEEPMMAEISGSLLMLGDQLEERITRVVEVVVAAGHVTAGGGHTQDQEAGTGDQGPGAVEGVIVTVLHLATDLVTVVVDALTQRAEAAAVVKNSPFFGANFLKLFFALIYSIIFSRHICNRTVMRL